MTAGLTLRAATLADHDAVSSLVTAMGYRPRSAAGWQWLFVSNPARADYADPPEIGWVLEREGAVLGYLGNIPLRYVLDGRPVCVGTCADYFVHPAARAESTRLLRAFFRQPGVEIFLTTTANSRTAAVYRLFDATAPVDRSFQEQFVWVADDRVVIAQMLANRGMPHALGGALAAVAAPLCASARAVLRFAQPPRNAAAASIVRLRPEDLDERLDRLWEVIASEPGLRVRRDATALRWYLRNPDAIAESALFAAVERDAIRGYIAVAPQPSVNMRVAQLEIVDLVARPGCEEVIPALMAQAAQYARDIGIGVVSCRPGGEALASAIQSLRPHVRRHSEPMHYIRAAVRTRTTQLARGGLWHATGLDGDAPLALE